MLTYTIASKYPNILDEYERLCGIDTAEAAWTPEAVEAAFGDMARSQKYIKGQPTLRQADHLKARRAALLAWQAKRAAGAQSPKLDNTIIKRFNDRMTALYQGKVIMESATKVAAPLPMSDVSAHNVSELCAAIAKHEAIKLQAQRLADEAAISMAQAVMNGWEEDGFEADSAYMALAAQERLNSSKVMAEAAQIAHLRAIIGDMEAAVKQGEEPIRRAGWAPVMDKATYAVRTFGMQELLGQDFMSALAPAFELMKLDKKPKGWMSQVDNYVRKARAILTAKMADGHGESLKAIELAKASLTESAATNLAVDSGREVGKTYAIGKLELAKRLRKLAYTYRVNGNVKRSNEAEIRAIVELINEYAQHVGVNIDGARYVLVCSTPGQAKVGNAYFADARFMAETWKKFWVYGQGFDAFKSNGTEEMKRMALLFTPSTVAIGKEGQHLAVNSICMLPEVATRQMLGSLLGAGINDSSFHKLLKRTKKVVRWDGALFLLSDVFGSGFQFRSHGPLALKGLAVNAVSALREFIARYGVNALPDTKEDVDGRTWAFPWSSKEAKAQHPVALAISTTSIWKGKSLGLSWSEAVAKTMALAAELPEAPYLRAIRYIDGAEDGQRKLGRQLLQQCFGYWRVDDNAAGSLCDEAITKQLRKRSLSAALAQLGELDRPEEDRSDFARLLAKKPELLLTEAMQAYLRKQGMSAAKWLAAGKIPVEGTYPYLVEDPLAFFEVIFLENDPQDPDIGVLKAGEISAATYADGEELACCRMPANWLVAMVLTNRQHQAFSSCGSVCVINAHDATLVIADGDTDGDEWLITAVKIIIKMIKMARSIPAFVFDDGPAPAEDVTPVLAFEHPEGPQKVSFSNAEERRKAIAKALTNTAYNNNVGRYSNGASAYLAAAAECLAHVDQEGYSYNLEAAAWLSIAAILIIDAAKNGDMPPVIKQKVEDLLHDAPTMPWNQRFNNGWSEGEFQADQAMDRPTVCGTVKHGYLPDEVGHRVWSALKDWSFDAEGLQLHNDFVKDILIGDGEAKRLSAAVDSAFTQLVCETVWKQDEEAEHILSAIKAGEPLGVKELVRYFWRNESAMKYRMRISDDIEETRENSARLEAYHMMVEYTIVAMAYKAYGAMGVKRVVNYLVGDALDIAHNNVGQVSDPEKQLEEKGSYALFVLQCFAGELLHPEWLEDTCAWETIMAAKAAQVQADSEEIVVSDEDDLEMTDDDGLTGEDWEALQAGCVIDE